MNDIKTHEEIIEFAKAMQAQAAQIVESGEEHMPIMFVLSEDGTINAVGFELNEKMKETWQIAIPNLLRKFMAYAYISINETWTAKLTEDSPYKDKILKGEIRISELPPDDRGEQLMMILVEKGQKPVLWFAEICYKQDKRFIRKWDELLPKPNDFTGRMIVVEW